MSKDTFFHFEVNHAPICPEQKKCLELTRWLLECIVQRLPMQINCLAVSPTALHGHQVRNSANIYLGNLVPILNFQHVPKS